MPRVTGGSSTSEIFISVVLYGLGRPPLPTYNRTPAKRLPLDATSPSRSILPVRRGLRRRRRARHPPGMAGRAAPDLGDALLDAASAAARAGAAPPPAPGLLARQLAVRLPRLLPAAARGPRPLRRRRAGPAGAGDADRGHRA